MYQSPRYGCRPPLQDPPGVPSGYRGFPPGPPPPMSCWGPTGPAWHAGRGPYWRPNIPPPGPGMRMQWPPSGPGPCGYGPPPGHQMTGPPPPPGYQMSNQPQLPQIPGHHFHGAVKRKHPGSDTQPQKKKKPHMDKRELAENNVFFCDTCDRGFKTEDKYHEHVMGHEQCSVVGCPFVAAPKLVALHYNLQHRSGLAKQIWKLESKEDVANWIESRKRNYPTASNIAKKQADLQARQDRGEVLHTKHFGKMRGNRNGGRGRGRGRAWQENTGRKEQSQVGRSKQTEEEAVSKETTENSSVCEESNTDRLKSVSHLPCADRKVGDNGQSSPVESSCNALGSIVASYGSDNDNDDNIPATEPHECALNNRNKVHGITAQKASTRPDRRKRVAKQQRQQMKKLTLLEKLLAADIRHERNIILQCVRYIARHHFFNEKLGDTPEESAPKTQKLHEQIV